MRNILLTGFEPFADWDVNPTQISSSRLDGKEFGDIRVVGKVIPLRYNEIKLQLLSLVEEYKPVAAVLTGQAGEKYVQLERVAHNQAKTETPYNCGSTPNGEELVENGPDQLRSSLPLQQYYTSLEKYTIPVQFSDSAGKFGCNQIFYLVRYYFPDLTSGFIHVPLLPGQTRGDKGSMSQEMITKAIEVICKETSKFILNE